MTAPGGNGGPLLGAAARAAVPATLHADLMEMALRGLAYSGTAEAERRLWDIASGRGLPGVPGRDFARSAERSLELYELILGIAPAANPLAPAAVDGTVFGAQSSAACPLSGGRWPCLDV